MPTNINTSRIMARDKMRRAKTAILSGGHKRSLKDIVSEDRAAFSGLRMLYASDFSGTPIQKMLAGSGHITSALCGTGVLAFSDEIEQQMNVGQADLGFAVRAVFDTNLLSDLPKYFGGENISTRDRVTRTLEFVEKSLGRNVDWSFASLENLREASKPNNPWPYLKVAAIRHFQVAGTASATPIELEKFIPAAEEQWKSWLGSNECWHQIARRDLVYAVLLFVILECWKNAPILPAMSRLVDFCLSTFGTVPLKELYFGWKALRGIHAPQDQLSIFSEPALRSPSKSSLDRVSALAWDLFLFRWCETLMTEQKGNIFFVPAVTTLDEGLLGAIKACQLRALLIHDDAQMVEAVFDDELEFQVCLREAINKAVCDCIEDPERQEQSGEISRYVLSSTINSLEKEVAKMVKATGQ